MLGADEIKAIIPHREPFLLISRVIDLEPGKYTVAEWDVSADDPWFEGHFPGRPILPGVLMMEAIAQAGAVAALSLPKYKNKVPVFGSANNIKFRRQVVPGETLRLSVTLNRCSTLGGIGRGEAFVNGEICCEGDLMFAFVKDSSQ